MSSNNGNGSSSLLEQVLQDCTPAQQARALKIARQTGLEDDDPSFVIPLATGKMQVLLEDAPERMGELLGQWRADVESACQTEVAGVREAGREAVTQQTQKAKRELVEAHQKESKQFRQEVKKTFSEATERAVRELHRERDRQDNAWLRERVRRETAEIHLFGGFALLLIGWLLGAGVMWFYLR
jgi:DNA anti-recombination protein RmuC